MSPGPSPGYRPPPGHGQASRLAFWILLLALMLVPLVFVLLEVLAGTWAFPSVFPQEWKLRGLAFLQREAQGILASLGLSLGYSFAAVLVSLLMCWAPAKFLARHSFRGKAVLEGLLLAPALLPAISYALGLQFIFIRLGLVDHILGVILVLSISAYPYMLRSLKIGFLAFDPRYEDAARNLGAGPWRRFFLLEAPALFRSILAGGSLVFLISFTEYFLVLLIGGGVVQGFSSYLAPFIRASDRSASSALLLVFLVIPLLLFLCLELLARRLRRAHA